MRNKTCPICNEEKPLSEFDKYWSKSRKKYRPQNYCRACQKPEARKRASDYYRRNTHERLEYAKRYREQNKDALREKKRKYKRKYIKELKECYVAEQLSTVIGIPQRNLTDDQIQAYKTVMKIRRKCQEINSQT